MTIACGTGSPPTPTAAPLRATTPNNRNTPPPIKLKARILRSGWGCTVRPNRPRPTSTALQKPYSVAALIVAVLVPAAPPPKERAFPLLKGSPVFDGHDKQFGMRGRACQEGAGYRETGEPDCEEHR